MSKLPNTRPLVLATLAFTFVGLGCSNSGPAPGPNAPQPGQTDFTTSAPAASGPAAGGAKNAGGIAAGAKP